MLLLIHLSLYHSSKFCQIMVNLRILQHIRANTQNTDISHIASAILHRQHYPLLPRLYIQKALQNFVPAVLLRDIPGLLCPQPAAETTFVFLIIPPHAA